MSRHAGFVPAARFEVASETDSFREGREASDGDGAGGSRDAVPPPRPTGVPAAVLSGERARRAKLAMALQEPLAVDVGA